MVSSWSVLGPTPITRHYEKVVCDLCGCPDHRVLATIPRVSAVADPLQRFCLDGLDFPDGGIALVRCVACGFGYQNPRLSVEGMQVFYDRFYDPSGPASAYHRTAQPGLDAARYQAIARTGRTSGIVLDVGAGNGYALQAFPAATWERHGLDVSSAALGALTRRLPEADVHLGSLSSAGLPDLAFDVVTMNSTLEHLRDPVDTLVQAARILKPGGLLVFNVPNLASPSRVLARAMKQNWPGLTPEHLNYFTVKVLAALAPKVGFRQTRHHTVGYEEARPRFRHLGDQILRIGSGVRRVVQRRPDGWERIGTGLGIVADWPVTSTGLGSILPYGENITGFWER